MRFSIQNKKRRCIQTINEVKESEEAQKRKCTYESEEVGCGYRICEAEILGKIAGFGGCEKDDRRVTVVDIGGGVEGQKRRRK